MSKPMTCGKCGAELLAESAAGLCPRCLMALNFDSRTMPEDEAPQKAAPLSPEEMHEHFPQFEVLECLGRGGMGVVYKARQKTLDRPVAIKLLAGEWQGDAGFATRFEKEAKTLAQMSHPNIVTVHDFGNTAGLFYIVMEYVDGVNLRDLLREGKMEPEQALAIIPSICLALEYAHDKGVVHRDIKPENILLDREGRVKIADFGIASLVGVSGETSGTPPYMAPEQEKGLVDRRSDIYALGAVLYEMLTGDRPNKELVAPSRKVQIDVRLDEIVLRALEKTPDLRYQTAREFRTVLETLAATPNGIGLATARPSPNPSDQSGHTSVPANPTSRVSHYVALVAFLSSYAGLLIVLASTAGQLPPQVASHFGAEGHPNGWMSRSFYLAFVGAMPLLFGGVAMLVSWMTHRLPARFLNIPRRDFWLTPERRPETAAFLRRRMFWLAVLMTNFFAGLHLLTVHANQSSPARLSLDGLLALIIVFLLAMMIWTISLLMRLAEVEKPLPPPSFARGQESLSGPGWIEQAELDALSSDRRNWHAFLFYYCAGDPRIVVPKRIHGFGWTLNFANPWSIPFLLALLAGLFAANDFLGRVGFSTRESQLPWFLVVLASIVLICHRMAHGPIQRAVYPPPFVRSIITAVIALGVGLAAVSWRNQFSWPGHASREISSPEVESSTQPTATSPVGPLPDEFTWRVIFAPRMDQTRWENPGPNQAGLPVVRFERPAITARRYAVIGEVRYERVEGTAFLEMWNHLWPMGKYFTRTLAPSGSGPLAVISGSSDWRPFTLPFDRGTSTSPVSNIEVNLQLPGKGAVYLRGLRLVEDLEAVPIPAGKEATTKPIPPEAARVFQELRQVHESPEFKDLLQSAPNNPDLLKRYDEEIDQRLDALTELLRGTAAEDPLAESMALTEKMRAQSAPNRERDPELIQRVEAAGKKLEDLLKAAAQASTSRDATSEGVPTGPTTPKLTSISVNVLGRVKQPGTYQIAAGTQVSSAVDAAGGLTEKVDRLACRILRGEAGTVAKTIAVPWEAILNPAADGPVLQDRDTVYLEMKEDASNNQASKVVTITLAADGALTVAGQPCPLDQLADRLKALAGEDAVLIRLQADKKTPYRQVVAVLDACKDSGIKDITFSVESP